MINSGFEKTVPMIQAAVESLGFKMRDIKVLLASHAHSDHVAGHALAKELTGARVFVMRGDDEVISAGGKGQYLYKDRWKPCAVDRVLEDGDEVALGGVTLTARRTPGPHAGLHHLDLALRGWQEDVSLRRHRQPEREPGLPTGQ